MPVFAEETGTTAVLKLPDIGDTAKLALVDIDNSRQARTIDGDPKTWEDGSPKMTKIVHAVILETAGATLGDDPARPGDTCAIYVEGGTYVEWKKALEEYAKPVATGTRFSWTFERTEPAKTRGYNDRKVRAFRFADPTAETTTQCETLYDQRHTTPPPLETPTAALRPDEEPF